MHNTNVKQHMNSLNLETICDSLFGERYNINPDGPDRIVINCQIPWETVRFIVPSRMNLPENEDLMCGLKLCNIPGTILLIYPGEQEGNYNYYLVRIPVIPDPEIKRQFRKMYIAWAQKHKVNVEFDLDAIIRRQRERG